MTKNAISSRSTLAQIVTSLKQRQQQGSTFEPESQTKNNSFSLPPNREVEGRKREAEELVFYFWRDKLEGG